MNTEQKSGQPEPDECGSDTDRLKQDMFTCGSCEKNFHNVLEFLEHRSDHASETDQYHCCLCKCHFSRKAPLVQHYKRKHKLTKFLEEKQTVKARNAVKDKNTCISEIKLERQIHTSETNSDTKNTESNKREGNGNEMADVKPTQQEVIADNKEREVLDDLPLGGSTNPVQDSLDGENIENQELMNIDENMDTIHVDIIQDTTVGDTETMETDSEMEENLNVDIGDKQDTGNDAVDEDLQDFHFILSHEKIKGKSLEYMKFSLKCLHCDYKTEQKSYIIKHMKRKHLNVLCINKSIDIKEAEVGQKDGEIKEKLISLSLYNQMFRKSNARKKRTKKHPRAVEMQDVIGTYPCTECNKVFERLRYLRRHFETHRLDKKYICDTCGKGFKTQTYLYNHKKIHNEKIFKCSQCTFTSSISAAIHAHRQLHSQGSVLCDTCGYAYADKSTLTKHKRVHNPNRPFSCNFPGCTWRFNTEFMCRAHIRAHTSEGKFRCSHCGYVFRHKHHLQRHEVKTHGVAHDSRKSTTDRTSLTNNERLVLEIPDSVSLIMGQDTEQLQASLQNQQLVVATDANGTPITYETTDIAVYHALLQNEGQDEEGKQLFVSSEQGEVFEQESAEETNE